MNVYDVVIVVLFMTGMFWVGAKLYRWAGSTDDFTVAGRQLTPFILASVIAATNVNLYSFIGQAGIAYKEGIPIIWQTWTGNMALVFSGLFVIPILRRLRIRTIPEFLELRYHKHVRTFVAVLWTVRLSFWLGVVLYAAVIAAPQITGFDSFTGWVLILSVVVILYTMLGGMWSVTFTDVIQFALMLLGALIILPVAMAAVGWWPGLESSLPEGHLTLVKTTGTYDWTFILAIFLLGIEWACVDQGLLQRAFGARSTVSAARGLVLAGIITTPFALLWILPGLASSVLFPGLENADTAFPTLIASLIPNVVLGLIVVGLLSSQLSTLSGNLNGVSTIVASDLYANVFRRDAPDTHVLRVARVATLGAGIGMVVFAYLVPVMGGAVNAYLTIIAIMDMPLFIIAIVYGLLWKRISWRGALTGYIVASCVGAVGTFVYGLDFNTTTFITAGVCLIVAPIASFLMKHDAAASVETIWAARQPGEEEKQLNEVYHIWPQSALGRGALGVLAVGLLIFLTGVITGGQGYAYADTVAVGGVVLFFGGGLLRTFAY